MSSVSSTGFVTSEGGQITIEILEIGFDAPSNTSSIQVTGTITNGNGTKVSTHSASDIPASIGGDQAFTGSNFNIPGLQPGATKTFIQHTFSVEHDSGGGGSCTFVVRYGTTGTTIFGDNKSQAATLNLSSQATSATAPSIPQFSNVLPTSLTVGWDAPEDDGGWPISSYSIGQWNGDAVSGSPAKVYTSTGLTRNITGLTAGATYTFEVTAYNGHGDNGGYSDPSEPATVQTLAGSWMRVDGVWKITIPYVRVSGVWKMAVPWIRQGGDWKQTH